MKTDLSRLPGGFTSSQALFAFLFLLALFSRLFQVTAPPLGFHPTRQYRALLIARGYYFQSQDSLPEWRREVARINQARQGILEPPVMEQLVAAAYHVAGGEYFWISRIFTILFWLGGGFILERISRRIMGPYGGLFAVAFFLLLPFAVEASRSFQPDPLMILLALASILAVLRYDEQPSKPRLLAAGFLTAAAIFIKPVAMFSIFAVFTSLVLVQGRLKKQAANPRFLLFFGLTLLPSLLFYFFGILTRQEMQTQSQASFLPGLLVQPFFWRSWLAQIDAVVGYPAFLLGLLGVLMVREVRSRAILVGWWTGYVLFCLVFNYHTATHDYYHLQLVPLVGLSLGPAASLVLHRLLSANPGWYERLGMAAILLAGLALTLLSGLSRLDSDGFKAQVSRAQEVGAEVDHSTRTVFLDSDYGLPLEFHGELSGVPWPLATDLEWEQLAGVPTLSAQERFERDFSADQPDFFIVMDRVEYEQQEDLVRFLSQIGSLSSQDDHYLVFNLQGR
jgi:hypothetical protein